MKVRAPRVRYLALEGLRRPVALHDCDELLPLFSQILGTWPGAVSREAAAHPVISIRRRGDRFVLNSPWAERDLADDSGPGTVCSTLVDLATEFAIDNPSLLGLHCGAVDLGGRLVLFPAATRTGKSTLIARLAAAGHCIWADDLLAVDPVAGTGRAFGILPRLRRPVPRAAGRVLANFVRARKGVADRRQVYLALNGQELAGFGETCRLGAIVLPERQARGAAMLEPVGPGKALERLLLQNLAQVGAASDLLDALAGLAARLPAFRLRYCDLDEAADLLAATDWPRLADMPGDGPGQPREKPRTPRKPALGRDRLVRDPTAELREIDGERFLVSSRSQAIFGLNPVAAGVWGLLEAPITEEEIGALVTAAFPNIEPAEVARDVHALLRRLVREGLVLAG